MARFLLMADGGVLVVKSVSTVRVRVVVLVRSMLVVTMLLLYESSRLTKEKCGWQRRRVVHPVESSRLLRFSSSFLFQQAKSRCLTCRRGCRGRLW